MRKNIFIIVLTIEILGALIAMGLLFADLGAIIYLITAVVLAAVLTPCFLQLKKTPQEDKRRKLRRNIVLIPLIPIGICVIVAAFVIISLFSYFG